MLNALQPVKVVGGKVIKLYICLSTRLNHIMCSCDVTWAQAIEMLYMIELQCCAGC